MRMSPVNWAVLCLLVLNLKTTCAAEQIIPSSNQLNSQTFWFGNNWGGGSGPAAPFMQQSVDDIALGGDRIYAITGWDEHGSEAGIYSTTGVKIGIPEMEGDWNAQFHSWGFCGGQAVALSDSYVFYAMGQNGDANKGKKYVGVARYTREGKGAGWKGAEKSNRLLVSSGEKARMVTGLAVFETQLFIADPSTDKVLIFNVETMEKIGEFICKNPGRMAIDAGKERDLWVIDSVENVVRRYSREGKLNSISIKDCLKPVALCIDVRSGDVFVVDGAESKQEIRRYKAETGKHVPDGVFGSPIYLGPKPGTVTAGKFFRITGIATDAEGSLYVSEWGYGAKLHKFTATRAEAWVLKGLEFVSCADADPLDDSSVYSAGHRYRIDHTKKPSETWTEAAVTLDPLRFPQDPRLQNPWLSMRIIRIKGQKLMFGKQQMDGRLYVWRFDGEIAVPAAIISPSANGNEMKGDPASDFAVRWSGFLTSPTTGRYTLSTIADDGVRVKVDGKLLIDQWRGRGATEDTTDIELEPGKRVPITIEYFQGGGQCSMSLGWYPPGQPRSIIPGNMLSCDAKGLKPGLEAEFFRGHDFKDSQLKRVDKEILYPTFIGEVSQASFGAPKPTGWPLARPLGPYVWQDRNGDGNMQAEEYTSTPELSALSFDELGNLVANTGGWDAGKGAIVTISCTGLDARGVPQWDWSRLASTPIPTEASIQNLSKVYYDTVTDRMFVGAWTKEHPFPGGGWEQMSCGPVLIRFDTWSKKPTMAWSTVIVPPEGQIGSCPKSWSFERDHVFVGSTWQHEQVAVDVYHMVDGKRLGRLLPTAEIGGVTGWFDMNDSIQSHKRTDGSYMVFGEECWMAKGIYWVWKP